jgi:chitosanase
LTRNTQISDEIVEILEIEVIIALFAENVYGIVSLFCLKEEILLMKKRNASYRGIFFAVIALMAIIIGKTAVSAAVYVTAPSGLKTTAATSTSVDLSWKATSKSSNVKLYDVYMDNKYLTSVSTTTFTVGDLLPSTTHKFYIQGKDSSGNTSGAIKTIIVKTEPKPTTASTVTAPVTAAAQTKPAATTVATQANTPAQTKTATAATNTNPAAPTTATTPVSSVAETKQVVVAASLTSTAQTSVTKAKALQMTTACENSTTKLQYNYAENIGDGRGVTFGYVGFCTGTYDGNMLIKYYTKLNPNNTLAKYIPALDAIDRGSHSQNGGDSNPGTAGLDGFIKGVNNCTDPLFKQAQIYMADQLYWNPAVKIAGSIGAKNMLTQAFIYDMCVNHGEDGAQEFINKAKTALGGTPATGIDENTFLSKVMDLRYSYLKTEDVAGSDRVNAFRRVLASGNVNLSTPFSFKVYGDTFTIDGSI